MDAHRHQRRRSMGLVLTGLICLAILRPVGTAAGNSGRAGMPADPSDAVFSLDSMETPPAGVAQEGRHAPDLMQSGTRLFSATLVVIGLLALGSYGIRRLMNHRGSLSRPGTMIRVVTTRSLGARSSLAVIEIGDERFVIGVSPQRISFLTALAWGGNSDELSLESVAFERELQRSRGGGKTD